MKVKELVSRINLPARASMGYLGASLVGKAIGLITTPFFTRLVSEDEYGILILYMTVLGGVSVVCSAVSSGSAVYTGFKKFGDKNGGYVKSVLAVSLCFSAAICLVLFAFLPFFGFPRAFYLPLILQVICDSAVGVSMARARYRYKYFEVMIVGILSSAIPAMVSIFILTKFGRAFGVRIYTLLLVSLIVATIQLIRLLRLPGRADRSMVKYTVRSSLPLLPHSLSVSLGGQADKMFITSAMGAAALAKYSVVHSLGIALQFAVTSLGSALGPWIIRRLDADEEDRISEVVATLFSLFCALSLGLCALAPEAMRLLAPSKYLEALPALIPIALSTPLSLISYAITVGLVHVGRGKFTAVISLTNLSLVVLFNYTLIPRLGYLGAGLALLLSQLASLLLGLVLIRWTSVCNMFSARESKGIFLLTAISSIALFFLYQSTTLRVAFLIIPAIIFLNSIFRSKRLIME